MDEPFGSLDADTRTSLQKELVSIWSKSKVTMIVTHNIIKAISISTKVLVHGAFPDSVKLFGDNPVVAPPG
jgi:ABC-type nitrate/sulfonate/bicarbonate transport system, ATPase component